jgi:hypothetical protein
VSILPTDTGESITVFCSCPRAQFFLIASREALPSETSKADFTRGELELRLDAICFGGLRSRAPRSNNIRQTGKGGHVDGSFRSLSVSTLLPVGEIQLVEEDGIGSLLIISVHLEMKCDAVPS